MSFFKKKSPPQVASNNSNNGDPLTNFATNLGCCILLLQLVESQISTLLNQLDIKENGKEVDWAEHSNSLSRRIKQLEKQKILPKNLIERVDRFRKARNEAVHALATKKDFSIFNKDKIQSTYLQVKELRIEANALVTFFTSVISESALLAIKTKEKTTIESIQLIISKIELPNNDS